MDFENKGFFFVETDITTLLLSWINYALFIMMEVEQSGSTL